MTSHKETGTRIAKQITLCDEVLERLTHLDDNGSVYELIEDVKELRASLKQNLVSLDGHGSQPSS